jgi:hypothetical protein
VIEIDADVSKKAFRFGSGKSLESDADPIAADARNAAPVG